MEANAIGPRQPVRQPSCMSLGSQHDGAIIPAQEVAQVLQSWSTDVELANRKKKQDGMNEVELRMEPE